MTLNTKEVAKKLQEHGINISQEQVARLAGLGIFPGVEKEKKPYQIPSEDVDKFIRSRKRQRRWITISGITFVISLLSLVSISKDGIDLIALLFPKTLTEFERLMNEGEQFFNNSQYTEAEQKFTAAHTLDSNSPEPLFRLGKVAFARQNYDVASEYVSSVLKINHKHQPSVILVIKIAIITSKKSEFDILIEQSRGLSEELDLWLDCVSVLENDFRIVIITETEIHTHCPPPIS